MLVIKAKNGNVVKLPDIATIVEGTRNTQSAAWFNLQPAVLLFVTKQANANVIDTVDQVRALLPEIKRLDSGGHRYANPVRSHRDHSGERA